MPVDINVGMPLNNNFASVNSLYTAQDIQNRVDEMFRLGYQDGLRSLISNQMLPSTTETLYPILNDQQTDSNYVKMTTDAMKIVNNMEIGDEQTRDLRWYSEFEELKSAQNQKVNIKFTEKSPFTLFNYMYIIGINKYLLLFRSIVSHKTMKWC